MRTTVRHFREGFFKLVAELEHVSWMGRGRNRKAVSRLCHKVSEYQIKRQSQLPAHSHRVIELVDEMDKDIHDLYNQLRRQLD